MKICTIWAHSRLPASDCVFSNVSARHTSIVISFRSRNPLQFWFRAKRNTDVVDRSGPGAGAQPLHRLAKALHNGRSLKGPVGEHGTVLEAGVRVLVERGRRNVNVHGGCLRRLGEKGLLPRKLVAAVAEVEVRRICPRTRVVELLEDALRVQPEHVGAKGGHKVRVAGIERLTSERSSVKLQHGV